MNKPRHRYSIDLNELEDIIVALAEKEGRNKANMAKQLIREGLIARGLLPTTTTS